VGSTPKPFPRGPEDGLPHGGIWISATPESVTYELLVRLSPRWPLKRRRLVVIRCCDRDEHGQEHVYLSEQDAPR
jgi:hypothetical protein